MNDVELLALVKELISLAHEKRSVLDRRREEVNGWIGALVAQDPLALEYQRLSRRLWDIKRAICPGAYLEL